MVVVVVFLLCFSSEGWIVPLEGSLRWMLPQKVCLEDGDPLEACRSQQGTVMILLCDGRVALPGSWFW